MGVISDWFTEGRQSEDGSDPDTPAIINNENFSRRVSVRPSLYYGHWFHSNADIRQHFWATSFLLPFSSILILALVILLMILFKRYPHMVAAIVAGILCIIIIFATLITLNHRTIYT